MHAMPRVKPQISSPSHMHAPPPPTASPPPTVRVFQSQNILSPHGEPHCCCTAGGLFWVALHNVIRGYSAHTTADKFHRLYEFRPLWPLVREIRYLPALRRVVTLEEQAIMPHSDGAGGTTATSIAAAAAASRRAVRVYHLAGGEAGGGGGGRTVIRAYTLPIGNTRNSSGSGLGGDGRVALIDTCPLSNAILVSTRSVLMMWALPDSLIRQNRAQQRAEAAAQHQHPHSANTTTATTTTRSNSHQHHHHQKQQHAHAPYTDSEPLPVIDMGEVDADAGGMDPQTGESSATASTSPPSFTAAPHASQSTRQGMAANHDCVSCRTTVPICIVKVHTSWPIRRMAVFREFVAFSSDTDVRVLKIKFTVLPTSAPTRASHSKQQRMRKKNAADGSVSRSGSVNNATRDTMEKTDLLGSVYGDNMGLYVYWGVSRTSSEPKTNVEIRFDDSSQDLVPSAIHSTTLHHSAPPPARSLSHARRNEEYDEIGETPNVDHPAFINAVFVDSLCNMLHKHFKPAKDEIRSLHFIRNISRKSQFFDESSGMRSVICTSSKGFVYDLSTPRLLSEFEFGGECLASAVNSLFLFVATPAGLEVWSVLGSTGGCLLRFHPFIGLKSISVADNHVTLLSKFSSNESVSIAAYYNKSTSNLSILSDIRNVAALGSKVGSIMPLFTGRRRTRKTTSVSGSTAEVEPVTYSYNLYILDMVELREVYEDMLEKAMEAKQQASHVMFLKLLLESHSMLQSKYFEILHKSLQCQDELDKLHTELELHSYTELLYRSIGKLGDAYHAMGDLHSSANCYASSDRPLSYSVRMLEQSPRALMTYLEEVLFDENKCGIAYHDTHIGNMVISLYRQYAPHRLSTLVLESCLKVYSRKLAISLLQDLTGQQPEQQRNSSSSTSSVVIGGIDTQSPDQDLNLMMWNEVRPKDAFVLALLYIDTDMTDLAVKSLHSVEAHCIIEFCVANHNLLWTDSHPSALAMVLREHFVWCLLECLVRLHEKVSPTIAMDMLYMEDRNAAHDNRLLRQLYLCSLVCASSSVMSKDSHLTTQLMRLYVEELVEISVAARRQIPRSSQLLSSEGLESLMEVRQWCTFLQYSLIQYRHHWLSLITDDAAVNDTVKKSDTSPDDEMADLNAATADDDAIATDAAGLVTTSTSSKAVAVETKADDEMQNEANDIIRRRAEQRKRISQEELNSGITFPDEELSPLDIFQRLIPADKAFFALSQGTESVAYHMHVLYSAQGLLCCELAEHSYGQLLNTVIAGQGTQRSYVGQLSLQVLCMTAMRRLSNVFHLLLQSQPDALLTYAGQYCKTLEDWRLLVDILLTSIREGTAGSHCYDILERVLWRLSTECRPSEFLSLLPRNGSMRYFMRFVSRCFAHESTHMMRLSQSPPVMGLK